MRVAGSVQQTVIFFSEEPMRRMLTVLCARRPAMGIVADGDDEGMRGKAAALARESGMPLLLITRRPASCPVPEGLVGRCLVRPFLFEELYAALDALTGAQPPEEIPRGGQERAAALQWDNAQRTVRCGEATVTLTEREAYVFDALWRASPFPVSRETLRAGFDRTAGNGAEVYVTYLRRKLAALPLAVTIASRRGEGYALLIPGGAAEKL